MNQCKNSTSHKEPKSDRTCHLVLQGALYNLGRICHRNAGKIVFTFALALITLCVALKSAKIDTDLELWIEESTRVERELKYTRQTLGTGYGTTNQILIQTPSNLKNSTAATQQSILNTKAFMIHLEAMAVATHVSVELFEAQWNLRDLCYSPTVPLFGEPLVDKMLEEMIPCAIKTPLDCFWEGAKLLGPHTPVAIPEFGFNLRWTALNPKALVETIRMAQPHASFRYQNLLDFMSRAGISSGYLRKPCLDPTDPNCPLTAPNKMSQTPPDIGAELTGGCYGFAANHMHWHEDEIVGGVKKNKTGHIVKASALQSTIQLMGERDMFEFWQNDIRVYKRDWSIDKAKLVLEKWQEKFREEIDNFLTKSDIVKDYNLRQMTSSGLDSIMSVFSTPDYLQVGIAFVLMLLYSVVTVPAVSFGSNNSKASNVEDQVGDKNDRIQSKAHFIEDKLRTSALTFVGALTVALTIAASLGLSVFLGLSFNAATIQMLPIFALCIGFHNLITSIHAIAATVDNYCRSKIGINSESPEEQWVRVHDDGLNPVVTGEFLISSGPGILMTSLVYQIAFVAAAIIPIPALRTFCFQILIFIMINTITALIFIPSLIALSIRGHYPDNNDDHKHHAKCHHHHHHYHHHHHPSYLSNEHEDFDNKNPAINVKYSTEQDKTKNQLRCHSQPIVSKSSRLRSKNVENLFQDRSITAPLTPTHVILDDFDDCNLSRIKNDLMTVQVESSPLASVSRTTTFNISASICTGGVNTKFTLSSSAQNLQAQSHPVNLNINNLHNQPPPAYNDLTPSASFDSNENYCTKLPDVANTPRPIHSVGTITPTLANESISPLPIVSASNQEHDRQEQQELNSRNPDKKVNLANYVEKFLSNGCCRFMAISVSTGILIISIMGASRVNIGLDLSDVVPHETHEYRFMSDQQKFFPVFNTYAVTKGNFDYPNNQRLLHEYHEAFTNIESVVNKDSDGALPVFWLTQFRDWLLELQRSFDRSYKNGTITIDGWGDEKNEQTILAYKLLVQTGRLDNPIEKNLINSARLVDDQGLINPKSFYHCLTAWASNDAFIYSASAANIMPEPKTWLHNYEDLELKIPKSQPIVYVQTPYLMKMRDTNEIVAAIMQTRAIQTKFEQRNLPNYPIGLPFTFWEQFIHLNFYVTIAIGIALLCIFLVLDVVTFQMGVSLLVTLVSLITVAELYGIMGHVGIRFNANTAVAVIFATGISIIYTVHTTTGFLITNGTHSERIADSMKATALPALNSLLCTMIGAWSLMQSQFDYIVKFSQTFSLLIVLAAINCFLVLPALLVTFGPSSLPRFNYHESRRRKLASSHKHHTISSESDIAFASLQFPFSASILTPSPTPTISASNNYKYNRTLRNARNVQNQPGKHVGSDLKLATKSHNRSAKPKNSLISSDSSEKKYSKTSKSRARDYARVQSQISLSTISEESQSYKSSPVQLGT